jgi:integrase/recombinase XerD
MACELKTSQATTQTLKQTTQMKYSVKIIHRTEVKKADGSAPLALQSFINGKRVVIPLHLHILPACFNKAEQRIVSANVLTKQESGDLNLIIQKAKARASEIFTEYRLMGIELSPEKFRLEFQNPQIKTDFLQYMEKEIEGESLKELSTVSTYKQALTKLKAFRQRIFFKDLNNSLICEFHKFLRTKEKLSENSANKHHARIKYFINKAIKSGIKISNPYNDFQLKRIRGNRDYLFTSEVLMLEGLYLNQRLPAHLKRSLGKYLFSCYLGLRLSDIHKVGPDDVRDKFLMFIPHKTKNLLKILEIPFHVKAWDFVQYKTGGKFWEPEADQVINRNLKELAILAGIKKKITFHTARHTFATGYLAAGGSVEVLQQLLGHSKIEDTMVYVHISRERKRKEAERVKIFN